MYKLYILVLIYYNSVLLYVYNTELYKNLKKI